MADVVHTGPLTPDDLRVLNAFLVDGYTAKQIHEELGYTRARLLKLLNRSDVKDCIEEQRQQFKSTIAMMSDDVVNTLKQLMHHPSGQVRCSAIEKWLRAMNLYAPDSVVAAPMSAEDIAKELMKQGVESPLPLPEEAND